MSAPPPDITIQRRVPAVGIPAATSLRAWARAAQASTKRWGEITIRIVDAVEGRTLNANYRGKDYATNVLSFPHERLHPGEPMLGDLVICAPVVLREAHEQGKTSRAHWAHMVVHGVLHLLGHDHVQEAEAERMEALERRILGQLGFLDPYADPESA